MLSDVGKLQSVRRSRRRPTQANNSCINLSGSYVPAHLIQLRRTLIRPALHANGGWSTAALMANMAKDFGRLRTKSFHAGTRGPRSLTYGDLCFGVVQLRARTANVIRRGGRAGSMRAWSVDVHGKFLSLKETP
jgi:hypothetical protein